MTSDVVGADRRRLLRAFLVVPLAVKKKPTKRKAPAKKPATVAIATTLAPPPLTLAPASPSSVPPPGAPPITVIGTAVATTMTAADVAARNGAAIPVPEARAFLIGVTAERAAILRTVLPAALGPSLDLGVLAVGTTCTHSGCATTLCASSGWWECPCHGSRFDALGFHRSGPAPTGLGYFGVTVGADGRITVDARTPFPGVAPATPFIAADAAGPACVS